MASECASSEDKLGEDGAWGIFQAGLIEIPPGKWDLARRQEGLFQYWNSEKLGVEKESDDTLESNYHTLGVLLCSKIWNLSALKGILTWKLVKPGLLGFFGLPSMKGLKWSPKCLWTRWVLENRALSTKKGTKKLRKLGEVKLKFWRRIQVMNLIFSMHS